MHKMIIKAVTIKAIEVLMSVSFSIVTLKSGSSIVFDKSKAMIF
jgi:hypothetical protein